MKKEKIYYIAFDTNRMSIEEATYIIDNKSNNHYNCRDEKNNTHHVFNEKILDTLIKHKNVYHIFCKEKDMQVQKSIIQTIAKEISEQRKLEISNFLNHI